MSVTESGLLHVSTPSIAIFACPSPPEIHSLHRLIFRSNTFLHAVDSLEFSVCFLQYCREKGRKTNIIEPC